MSLGAFFKGLGVQKDTLLAKTMIPIHSPLQLPKMFELFLVVFSQHKHIFFFSGGGGGGGGMHEGEIVKLCQHLTHF